MVNASAPGNPSNARTMTTSDKALKGDPIGPRRVSGRLSGARGAISVAISYRTMRRAGRRRQNARVLPSAIGRSESGSGTSGRRPVLSRVRSPTVACGVGQLTDVPRQGARSWHEPAPMRGCSRLGIWASDCATRDAAALYHPHPMTVAPRRLASPSSVNAAIQIAYVYASSEQRGVAGRTWFRSRSRARCATRLGCCRSFVLSRQFLRWVDEAFSTPSQDFGHCDPVSLSVFAHSSQKVLWHPDGDNSACGCATRAGLDVRPQLDILVWIRGRFRGRRSSDRR